MSTTAAPPARPMSAYSWRVSGSVHPHTSVTPEDRPDAPGGIRNSLSGRNASRSTALHAKPPACPSVQGTSSPLILGRSRVRLNQSPVLHRPFAGRVKTAARPLPPSAPGAPATATPALSATVEPKENPGSTSAAERTSTACHTSALLMRTKRCTLPRPSSAPGAPINISFPSNAIAEPKRSPVERIAGATRSCSIHAPVAWSRS